MPRPYKRTRPGSARVERFLFSPKKWEPLSKLLNQVSDQKSNAQTKVEEILLFAMALKRTAKDRRDPAKVGRPEREDLKFVVPKLFKLFRGYFNYKAKDPKAKKPVPHSLRLREIKFVRQCLITASLIPSWYSESLRSYIQDQRLSGNREKMISKIVKELDKHEGRDK